MVMVKTSELTGAALDWAVAKAVPHKFWPVIINKKIYLDTDYEHIPYSPSTCWEQCGSLIEKYMVRTHYAADTEKRIEAGCIAQTWRPYAMETGETLLIAACRAIVASQLGDEVDTPEVLM